MSLILGDCLEKMSAIADGSIDMVLCDLPYGTTQNKWDTCLDLPSLWEHYRRVGRQGCPVVLFAQSPFDKILGASQIEQLRYEWIWVKGPTGFLNANKSPMKAHENILVFCRQAPPYSPQNLQRCYQQRAGRGDQGPNYGKLKERVPTRWTNYPRTVLTYPRDTPSLHPTQKPVALMEYLIQTYTNEGDTVLDNCMGSGTTGVACANLNRKFIGIEKDPTYYEIAVDRIYEAMFNEKGTKK